MTRLQDMEDAIFAAKVAAPQIMADRGCTLMEAIDIYLADHGFNNQPTDQSEAVPEEPTAGVEEEIVDLQSAEQDVRDVIMQSAELMREKIEAWIDNNTPTPPISIALDVHLPSSVPDIFGDPMADTKSKPELTEAVAAKLAGRLVEQLGGDWGKRSEKALKKLGFACWKQLGESIAGALKLRTSLQEAILAKDLVTACKLRDRLFGAINKAISHASECRNKTTEVSEFIGTSPEHVQIIDTDSIAKDLLALKNEFPVIYYRKSDDTLCVETSNITLEGYNFGRYRIVLPITNPRDYDIESVDGIYSVDDSIHPHVDQNKLCEGDDGIVLIDQHYHAGRFFEMLLTIKAILNTYSSDNPHHFLSEYVDGNDDSDDEDNDDDSDDEENEDDDEND